MALPGDTPAPVFNAPNRVFGFEGGTMFRHRIDKLSRSGDGGYLAVASGDDVHIIATAANTRTIAKLPKTGLPITGLAWSREAPGKERLFVARQAPVGSGTEFFSIGTNGTAEVLARSARWINVFEGLAAQNGRPAMVKRYGEATTSPVHFLQRDGVWSCHKQGSTDSPNWFALQTEVSSGDLLLGNPHQLAIAKQTNLDASSKAKGARPGVKGPKPSTSLSGNAADSCLAKAIAPASLHFVPGANLGVWRDGHPGQVLAANTSEQWLRIYDSKKRDWLGPKIPFLGAAGTTLQVSADGKYLAVIEIDVSVYDRQSLQLFSIAGATLRPMQIPADVARVDLAEFASGKLFVATASALQAFDLPLRPQEYKGLLSSASSLSVNTSGKIAVCDGSRVSVWNADGTPAFHTPYADCVVAAPYRDGFVVSNLSSEVHFLRNGNLREFEVPNTIDVATTGNGRFAVGTADNGDLWLRDTKSGSSRALASNAYPSSKGLLAIFDADTNEVKVMDRRRKKLLSRDASLGASVILWAAESPRLVYNSSAGLAVVVDVPRNQDLLVVPEDYGVVALSPSGTLVAVSDQNADIAPIFILDVESGRAIACLTGAHRPHSLGQFLSDSAIVTSSDAGLAIWNMKP